MLKNIFDTHAHYDDPVFANNLDEVLKTQQENGVCLIVNCGSTEEGSTASLEIAAKHDFVYAAVGLHPNEVAAAKEGWLERIAEMAKQPKVVAIGEIGLDYYYKDTDREAQIEAFERQIELASRLDLPVILHDRDSHGDMLDILKKHRPRAVLHRFSGSPEMAAEVVKMGMYIGVGCSITYKNSVKERQTVEQIPLEYLLLETDCPYLAPDHMRGKASTSDMIAFAAESIAEIRGIPAEEIVDIARENGKKFFGIE